MKYVQIYTHDFQNNIGILIDFPNSCIICPFKWPIDKVMFDANVVPNFISIQKC